MNHVRNNFIDFKKKIFIQEISNVMKILSILIIFIIFFPNFSFAQTKTPQKIPTSSEAQEISDKIDELKEKVASRVAQLKLVERRGIVGTVERVSDTEITITDHNGNLRIIDVDELTKFSKESSKSFGISDIKKGSTLSALGLYNKDSRRLLARFVNEIEIPTSVVGVITQKNEKDFTITLTTEEGVDYTVDVERITKTFSYDEDGLASSGFSKIEIRENATVLGFADAKEKNRISATRIITFPDIPSNPNVPIIDDDIKSTPTPTKKVQIQE
ncbi:MAG: hypothetical protein HYW63_02615 [Candidatus Levybacteria bacterium]|nr:hypothetical protein [Candidatus Levybacteria bacterium]